MCDNIRNRFRPGEVFLLGLCYFSEAFAAALGGFWAALAWVATIVVWISHEAHEDVGPGGRTRTCNPPVKSRMLWPVELRQEMLRGGGPCRSRTYLATHRPMERPNILYVATLKPQVLVAS